MKRHFKIFSILLFLLNAVNATFLYGQLSVLGGTSTQSWGFNATGVSRIGIGNFAISNLNSVLQVDGNTTANPTGKVFETDGPSGSYQYWTMNRGGTLIGGLSNKNTNTDLLIEGAHSICVNSQLAGTARACAIFHDNGNTGIGHYWI